MQVNWIKRLIVARINENEKFGSRLRIYAETNDPLI